MKYKMFIGILVFCVSILICLQTVLAASGGPPPPPYAWAGQATLSTADGFASQDPENSGFGPTQVTVWEEEEMNGVNWDIYMKYSLGDGAPGSWIFPPVHPAINPDVDEINPAVSVTRNHPITGQEIHVVYQRWNLGGGFWEIAHTYTNNLGAAWTVPVIISTPGVSSTNPAIVYTEEQAIGPVGVPMPFVVQVVWEEALPAGGNQIMYRAYVYDPTWVPVRGYLPGILAPPFVIRTPPPGLSSELPEIASTDERLTAFVFDFNFNIVWQETNGAGNWDIWYVDGTTTTSAFPPPPPPGIVLALPGRLNIAIVGVDHTDPDIAASQDYNPFGVPGGQSYYFHVDYVKQTPIPPPITFDVDHCYSFGATPTPGFLAFSAPAPVVTRVIPPAIPFDNPTIATKLTTVPGVVPIIFETWFAWEDNTVPPTDIWFRVSQYTSGPPPVFGFTVAAGRVPYNPNPGLSTEQNPELWNREDVLRPNPPFTHLVFDRNPDPIGGGIEVEYIDP